jgi:glucose dehydrogenase
MMFSLARQEMHVRPSAFRKMIISGLSAALGIGLGLVLTASSSRAQSATERRSQPAPAAVSPLLQNYAPVSAERLKNPADGDWLMIRRTYNGWGYSPLDQINTTNVSKLRLV